jgi:Flp pilus assembly protein TadG
MDQLAVGRRLGPDAKSRRPSDWLRFKPRRGTASVELAILLPFLTFIFLIAVNFARVFYFSQIIENCARNGALYASDLTAQALSP